MSEQPAVKEHSDPLMRCTATHTDEGANKTMELRHLQYFVAVAETLNFSRAAERLCMAQPPLSQQIQRLEEEVGAQLFYRTKRSVRLTEAGQLFLQEAYRTLSQAEHAIQTARRAGKGEIGRLAIGFVGSSAYGFLPTVIRTFRERFPDVELTLREITTVEQVQALHEDRIQVGFLRLPVSADNIEYEPVQREPFFLVISAKHPLASLPEIPLHALEYEPFIFVPHALAPGLYDQ
ncbi:MAG: LysR family transcriptional regulator, partial [Chloroflexi bacterium]|nr:LysR family transcriptional regulator [Chloroflexota bacterium]